MTHCKHTATIVYSRTLVIDRCTSCHGFLIWCVNDHHRDRPPGRHWHYAESSQDAIGLATRPNTGIVRPEPRAAKEVTKPFPGRHNHDDVNTEQANQ